MFVTSVSAMTTRGFWIVTVRALITLSAGPARRKTGTTESVVMMPRIWPLNGALLLVRT